MPDPATTSHATHDRELVAAYAAGDATGADLARARALVAGCPACAELHRDLRAIAAALPALPAPVRPRDFRLAPEVAATLRRPTGLRRLLAPFASARFAFAGPAGASLAALGIAGILLSGTLTFGGATALRNTAGPAAAPGLEVAPVTPVAGAGAGASAAASAVPAAGASGAPVDELATGRPGSTPKGPGAGSSPEPWAPEGAGSAPTAGPSALPRATASTEPSTGGAAGDVATAHPPGSSGQARTGSVGQATAVPPPLLALSILALVSGMVLVVLRLLARGFSRAG